MFSFCYSNFLIIICTICFSVTRRDSLSFDRPDCGRYSMWNDIEYNSSSSFSLHIFKVKVLLTSHNPRLLNISWLLFWASNTMFIVCIYTVLYLCLFVYLGWNRLYLVILWSCSSMFLYCLIDYFVSVHLRSDH